MNRWKVFITDLQVTLLRGVLVIVGLIRKDDDRITQGREMIAAWDRKRAELLKG